MSNYFSRRGIGALQRIRARARSYADAPGAFNTTDSRALADGRLPGDPEIVVHFPGTAASLYQLMTWIPVFEAVGLEKPIAIVIRDPDVFDSLRTRTSLPVVYARGYPLLAEMIQASEPKLILYVNHRSDNYQSLRFPDQFHIHIGHGESDKSYMASNQSKAYDQVFVAGDAAIDRLEANLLGFDISHLVKIGRPQFDVQPKIPALPDRPTVLYAPTYEGDIPEMRYTSVDVLGESIVKAVIAAPGLDLIYRPHPLTGIHDVNVRSADERIRQAIRSAEGMAHVDTDTPFNELKHGAHVLVADVSAVVLDFLETDRPYIVTDPGRVPMGEAAESALGAGYVLTEDNVDELVPMIREALESDPLGHDRARWRAYHFGDYGPGESLTAFEDALQAAMDERDRLVTMKRERLASGESRPRLPKTE